MSPAPRPKVLIIDDEESIRSSLKMIFEYEGYDVVLAANGEAGVKRVLEILRSGIDEALLGLGRASIHDLVREDVILPPEFDRGLKG